MDILRQHRALFIASRGKNYTAIAQCRIVASLSERCRAQLWYSAT